MLLLPCGSPCIRSMYPLHVSAPHRTQLSAKKIKKSWHSPIRTIQSPAFSPDGQHSCPAIPNYYYSSSDSPDERKPLLPDPRLINAGKVLSKPYHKKTNSYGYFHDL